MEDLREHYPNELFKTAVTRNVRLSEAPAFGTPVLYYDKFSKGAQNYLALAQEIIERTCPGEAEEE